MTEEKANTCGCCGDVYNNDNLVKIPLGEHTLLLCPECNAEYEKSKAKMGHWISFNWCDNSFGISQWGIKCNQCLTEYKYGLKSENYCPNCGAKMERG